MGNYGYSIKIKRKELKAIKISIFDKRKKTKWKLNLNHLFRFLDVEISMFREGFTKPWVLKK
jgi:hypothetical protein